MGKIIKILKKETFIGLNVGKLCIIIGCVLVGAYFDKYTISFAVGLVIVIMCRAIARRDYLFVIAIILSILGTAYFLSNKVFTKDLGNYGKPIVKKDNSEDR